MMNEVPIKGKKGRPASPVRPFHLALPVEMRGRLKQMAVDLETSVTEIIQAQLEILLEGEGGMDMEPGKGFEKPHNFPSYLEIRRRILDARFPPERDPIHAAVERLIDAADAPSIGLLGELLSYYGVDRNDFARIISKSKQDQPEGSRGSSPGRENSGEVGNSVGGNSA